MLKAAEDGSASAAAPDGEERALCRRESTFAHVGAIDTDVRFRSEWQPVLLPLLPPSVREGWAGNPAEAALNGLAAWVSTAGGWTFFSADCLSLPSCH